MNRIITTDWHDLPAAPHAGRLFAIGDVHGEGELLATMLDHLASIGADGQSDLVFLGDLIDRGPLGLRCLDLASSAGSRFGQVTLLPGNHEIMMLAGLARDEDFDLWFHNGGDAVADEIDPDAKLGRVELRSAIAQALPAAARREIETGPTHLRRGGLLFVHAGLHPHIPLDEFLAEPRDSALGGDRHWAWIRSPFLDWKGGWRNHGVDLVIHGHTPCADRLIETPEGLAETCLRIGTGSRINLDVGASFLPQLAALEIEGARFRVHLVQASE